MEVIVTVGLMWLATWWVGKRLFGRRKSISSVAALHDQSEQPERWVYPDMRHRPAGSWRQVKPWFQAAGVQHHHDDALAFFDASAEAETAGTPYGLDVEREPHNRHDRNAIALFGWWTSPAGRTRVKIGYVPRDVARQHRDPAKPIAAEIDNLYLAERYDGDGLYVGVRAFLLEPSARSPYWQGKAPRR